MSTIVTPKAIVEPYEGNLKHLLVSADWTAAGVDRPVTGGVVVSNRKLADRLVRAIEDGVAYPFEGILTDVGGNTYVGAGRNVMGKYMNSDLTKLGY